MRLTSLEGHRDDALRLKMEAPEALVQELAVKLQQELHRVDITTDAARDTDPNREPITNANPTKPSRHGTPVPVTTNSATQPESTDVDEASTPIGGQDNSGMTQAVSPPAVLPVADMTDTGQNGVTPTHKNSGEPRPAPPRHNEKRIAKERGTSDDSGKEPPKENGSNANAKEASTRPHGRKGKHKQPRCPNQGAPKQAASGGSAWVKPGPKVSRELILVGDNNVRSIADAVRETVNVPRAIGSLYSKKANATTAMGYIASYEKKKRDQYSGNISFM